MLNQLIGYVLEGESKQYIAYRNSDGHIHEVQKHQDLDWVDSDLSRGTSAPDADSAPTGYTWEEDSSQHVVYRSGNGHIHELRRSKDGSASQEWQCIDLATEAEAPNAAGVPTGYAWKNGASQHVVYRSADGHIHELKRDMKANSPKWAHVDLTAEATAPIAASDPSGYAWEGDFSQHVVYRGEDGHIHELWRRKDFEAWIHVNLTSKANGVLAAACNNPMGYSWEGDSTQHVVYRGVDGHIHELWGRMKKDWSGWIHVDLSKEVAGAPVAAGDPMGYTCENNSTQHVVYRSADGNVHKLWGDMDTEWSGWQHLNLTASADVPAALSDPIGYAWEGNSTQHVVYSCENGDIQELHSDSAGSSWGFRTVKSGSGSSAGALASIECSTSTKYDSGTFSGFDLDDQGNCLETHVGGSKLYYRVGSINDEKNQIDFGRSTRYASGSMTSVSLASGGNFVEVHASRGKLYSRVAKANFRKKTISWKSGGKQYQEYDTGSYCSVVVDQQNNCLEIHTGSSGLYYRIGNVEYQAKTIDWGARSTLFGEGDYSQCSLTMDKQGNCIATAVNNGQLYSYIGKFTGSAVEWEQSSQFDEGSLTSVALDESGNCIETHTKDDRLYYRIGKLDSNAKEIIWSEATQYSEDDRKRYSFTTVACDSLGNCFEIHVIAGSPNKMYYCSAKFM